MTATHALPHSIRPLVERGEIGGRTVQISEAGAVECASYPLAPLPDGAVRIRTVRSAISSGTETTFHGRSATNVYLHKRWNEELRLFEPGTASMSYPIVVGYRAAGEVVETRSPEAPLGMRVFGSWRHTEFTTLRDEQATAQVLPADLSWDDGIDIAQMGPICANAVSYAEGEQEGSPAVVFGAGVVGLITAQMARLTGADPVYVVDRVAERLGVAASLGLEPLDAADGHDIAASLKRRHGSEGIPVAWECTGSTRALHEAIRSVRRRGAVVVVGFYQGEAAGLMLGEEFHHNGIRLVCGQIGNVHPGDTWETLRAKTIGMALGGGLKLGALPRMTVAVERVADGVAALQRPGEALQVALSYGGVK